MKDVLEPIVTIASAIVGLAILAVLVSRNSATADVIGAAGGAFAQDIGAAVSPITGAGTFNMSPYGGYSGFGGFH